MAAPLEMLRKLTLCGFVLLIFGIVGMELFKGYLHYRCALPGFVEIAHNASTALAHSQQAKYDTGRACNVDITTQGDAPGQCPAPQTCVYFAANPHAGTETFDSVALAAIALM